MNCDRCGNRIINTGEIYHVNETICRCSQDSWSEARGSMEAVRQNATTPDKHDISPDDPWLEALKRKADLADEMAKTLEAVDKLWSADVLNFAEEMNAESPVGRVWGVVRAILKRYRGE